MISAVAVKFWFVAAGFLQGCAGPALVRSDADLPADGALVMFAVSTPGGGAPVYVAIGKDRALVADLATEEFVFSDDDAVGLRLGELHAFTVPAGDVRVVVTRIGDFWEFAGGKIEQTFEAVAGGVYYLGILQLEFADDADTTSAVYVDDRAPAAGTQPLGVDTTPRPSRSLVCAAKAIDAEPAARALVAASFSGREDRFANRAGNWQRARWGALHLEKDTRPVRAEPQP